MKLKLRRVARNNTYTIGKLYIDDKYFCDTIEDKDRGLNQSMSLQEITNIKVKSQTAIPIGTYKILWTHSPKYNRFMPLIDNVPGFSGIRIHSGNSERDTEGCILCGENKIKGMVINSRYTINKLYPLIEEACKNKDCFITVE